MVPGSSYLPHANAVLRVDGTGSERERMGRATLLHCMPGYFMYQGRWEDAERFLRDAVQIRTAAFGVDHPSTLSSMNNLASTYRNQGRWEEAEKLEVEVVETHKTDRQTDVFYAGGSAERSRPPEGHAACRRLSVPIYISSGGRLCRVSGYPANRAQWQLCEGVPRPLAPPFELVFGLWFGCRFCFEASR